MDSHAASTSGPASSRNTFSCINDPLNLTVCNDVSVSFKIGAETKISLGLKLYAAKLTIMLNMPRAKVVWIGKPSTSNPNS